MLSVLKQNMNWHTATWLIISLIILNGFDFYTTNIALSMGMVEANPFLNYAITLSGTVWAIFWIKLVGLSGLFLPYAFMERYRERCQEYGIVWSLTILNIIYLSVVISNFILIT